MRVLLINLPGESIRKPEEHCGLAFLKAYLDDKGIETDILDSYAKRHTLEDCLSNIEEWLVSVGDSPSVVGISPFVTSFENFVKVGEHVKKVSPKTVVCAGGHFASLNKEYLMDACNWLDAIIVGEGEISLYQMVVCSFDENIAGVYKRQFMDDFIPRERIKDLDSLPFQARYLTPEELEGQPFAITTSRGCYGECSFCSISSFYKLNGHVKQTYRSAWSVSEEIHYLVKKYGITSLKIVDDNFFRSKSDDFLDELADLMGDLDITIRLSARPNDITESRAKKLRRIGASVVGIGAESADEASLNLFNKGIDISYSDNAIKFLSDNGITCLVNFIMFNPIIDIDGLTKNCMFVKRHLDGCLFHRINSHLWIRSTDPIVDDLVEMGLCERKGFPYLECRYKDTDVARVFELFDIWCNSNMTEYYSYADILMANGISGNEDAYESYKPMIRKDVEILEHLILLCRDGQLESKGMEFINNCMGI